MDDLEKAVLISFDESGSVDNVLKSQALAFCEQVKESPSLCRICIEKLCFSKFVQVQFWCLQCLYDALRDRYGSMGVEEKSFIRKSVFSMICYESVEGENPVRVLDSPVFIKNKLAQVVVILIYLEYPEVWPSLFLDFLPHLSKGVLVIDMFCRVLNSLDDEFISLDYPRSGEEYGAAARIKDSMRQQCIAQIVRACYDIVAMYRNSEPDMCANVLDSLRRYISWIDIGLVANDSFTRLLFELLLLDGLLDQMRGASAKCVLAMVSKRMDPKPKLSLLQNLQIRRVFGLLTEDSDSELVSAVASLVTGFATEVLECHKRLNPEDGKGIADELLNEVLPSVFFIMQPSVFNTIQNSEVDITFSFIQFLSSYVGTMKNLPNLTDSQQHHVGQILEGIRALVQYDPVYRDSCDVLDKVGKEEEERMGEFRKDLFVLLRCIGRVAPDVTQMFIRNSLARADTSPVDRNVEEVEAALSLFYALGESLNEELMRTGSGFFGDLVLMLLSTKFPCHSNRLVALVYLETISRYMKFVPESTQYMPLVLVGAFLDERGIRHPNPNVCQRATYLFMRVVKLLKGKLVPYIETILQSLQDTVARFTSMNVASKPDSGSEDGSHIFEAIGLLIGMEEVPLEKQSKYLSALLTPLRQQVEVSIGSAKIPSPANIENIQQIIMAINALSKGFSERLVTASRPAIGIMFKETLDVLLQILVVFPKIDPLRSKVTSFIHRMVEILGTSVFPYLPKALEQLLTDSQPKELAALLVLLNQLICKFNTAVNDILEEVYPTIAGRIFNVLPRDVIPSGPGGVTEEIRELEELQRLFFTFLHVIATQGLSSVFLSPRSRGYLESTMQLLLYTSCNHKEITVRKACVQIFIRLIKDWCTRPDGEETVPGFQNFVIEAFAMNCCLYSVLDKSFEFRDANTLVLFGEIVLAQRIMYEKFGNNFLVHFVSKGFPTVHCPQDLAEQYCHKVQADDVKALKSFYQSFIENLRQQQNGSLVFR